MKRKLTIFQYGSEINPIEPTRYSPSDWLEFSISESSPSEKSFSMGAPNPSTSSVSDDSFSEFTVDSSSINTIPTHPHLFILLEDIEIQIEHLMAKTDTTLPSQWSLSSFSLEIIGEEGIQDRSYLIDVLSDLSQHGSQSWYWEEASQLLTLISSLV